MTNKSKLLKRSLVLVGLMGAGKSSIGRRLATRLGAEFIDADMEIEKAAGCSIEDIFKLHGETEFRDGERRVISRLLKQSPHVLATGGGAYMNDDSRATIRELGFSIWLRADINVLLRRVLRRNDRPLLKDGDPREVLESLITERHPVYAQADLIVDTTDAPHLTVVNEILQRLRSRADADTLFSKGILAESHEIA